MSASDILAAVLAVAVAVIMVVSGLGIVYLIVKVVKLAWLGMW